MTDDEFDRWHLIGAEGCRHENDDPFHLAIEQANGSSCDCPERAAWEQSNP